MRLHINTDNKQILHTREDIHTYIHGGRGLVELEAPSGKSHKYAFFRPSSPSQFPDDILFVYALHEDEKANELKLFYVGMIEQNRFRCTSHSRFLWENEITKGANFIVKMSNDSDLVLSTPMKLYHLGVCCRCGRKIKDNLSGVGKKCKSILKSNGE